MKHVTLILAALLAVTPSSCEKGLNRGLQEQKSYTRAAMEKYRQDPKVFQGSSPDVLETWSRADYVARAVSQQNIPGNWATTADKLNFLQPKIQSDTTGRPFCVVQRKNEILVLRMLSESASCTEKLLTIDSDHIQSGDMQFYGKSDYWIYVLTLSPDGKPKLET
jgi:hypothetical protein